MGNDRIRGHLDLLILSIVATGRKHGYAIVGELLDGSGGRFEMPEGTVYPALYRLEKRGLLESQWAEGATRKRRVYSITEAGRRALADEKAQWVEFSRGVQSLLGGSLCLNLT